MDGIPTKPNNQVQTSIVENVALLIIIVLGFFFFVRPQSAALQQANVTLQQAQAESQTIQDQKDTLSQLVTKIDTAKIDMTLVDEALPLEDRPTRVEVLLDGLVKAAGMKMSDLTFQSPDQIVAGNKALLNNEFGVDRKLRTVAYNMTVVGDMDQFKNMLNLIETNGRLVDITGIDMVTDQATITFKLQLKAYSYAP